MQTTNKEIVQHINDAFKKDDFDGFLSYCLEDVRWTMIGKCSIEGKEAVRNFLQAAPDTDPVPPEIVMEQTIAEGSQVASTGTMSMKNKNGETGHYGFCDVYLFEGNQVKEMTTYIVEMKNNEQQKS